MSPTPATSRPKFSWQLSCKMFNWSCVTNCDVSVLLHRFSQRQDERHHLKSEAFWRKCRTVLSILSTNPSHSRMRVMHEDHSFVHQGISSLLAIFGHWTQWKCATESAVKQSKCRRKWPLIFDFLLLVRPYPMWPRQASHSPFFNFSQTMYPELLSSNITGTESP